MADYYSHNDPRKKGDGHYPDVHKGSSASWIWALIVLVAVVALIALGASGGGDTTAPAATGETAAPAAAAPAVSE
jgi:hypothetical protein